VQWRLAGAQELGALGDPVQQLRARRKPLKSGTKSEIFDNFFHKNGICATLFLGRRIEPAPCDPAREKDGE
jgi:hypothetical protein